MSSTVSEQETSIFDEPKFMDHFNNFMSSLFLYGTLFFVLTFNFVAMSVSLHANLNATFSKKLGSAIFAFLFGLIYILFNYYLYYVLKKGKHVQTYSTGKMFPWY
jgi:hypothetical protein